MESFQLDQAYKELLGKKKGQENKGKTEQTKQASNPPTNQATMYSATVLQVTVLPSFLRGMPAKEQKRSSVFGCRILSVLSTSPHATCAEKRMVWKGKPCVAP